MVQYETEIKAESGNAIGGLERRREGELVEDIRFRDCDNKENTEWKGRRRFRGAIRAMGG